MSRKHFEYRSLRSDMNIHFQSFSKPSERSVKMNCDLQKHVVKVDTDTLECFCVCACVFQGLCDRVRPHHSGERRVHRPGRGESDDRELWVGLPGSLPAGDPAEALRLRAQSVLLQTQLLELVRESWRTPSAPWRHLYCLIEIGLGSQWAKDSG